VYQVFFIGHGLRGSISSRSANTRSQEQRGPRRWVRWGGGSQRVARSSFLSRDNLFGFRRAIRGHARTPVCYVSQQVTLANYVEEWLSHIQGLRQVLRQNHREQHEVFNALPREYWTQQAKRPESLQMLVRCARRRTAAAADIAPLADNSLPLPEEMYVFPTMGDFPLTGDILRSSSGFCVVLSPSCDMVRTEAREPKLSTVLVARADVDPTVLLQANGIDPKTAPNKLEPKIKSLLTAGYGSNIVALPPLYNILPTLYVDLKDLRLVQYASIGTQDTDEHKRIASLDSPFREALISAFAQTSTRVGRPETDNSSWLKKVMSDITDSEK